MGQCPPGPPSFDSYYAGFFTGNRSDPDGKNKTSEGLLTVHKPEPAQYCILDPSDVREILEQQRLKLSRRKMQIEAIHGCDSDLSETETDITEKTSDSEAASECTSRISNVSKPTTNSQPWGQKEDNSRQDEDKENKSGNTKRSDPASTKRRFDQNKKTSSNQTLKKGCHTNASQKAQDFDDSACPNPLLPVCSGGSSVLESVPLDQSKSVLHLKMEAHMVDFYLNKFLVMFPDSPQPKGMSSNRTGIWKRKLKMALRNDNSPPTTSTHENSVTTEEPQATSPVLNAVDDSSFLDCAFTGSLGLIDRGSPNPQEDNNTKNNSKEYRQKNPNHYLVLTNTSTGSPLAVCALKSPTGPPIVRIYATKQRVKGQKAATSTGTLGLTNDQSNSRSLYAWAELVIEGDFPGPLYYSLHMSTGSEGKFDKEPSFTGSHVMPLLPKILVFGRTTAERAHSGCFVLSLRTRERRFCTDTYFALSISKGVDPALFLCLTAIVDETMEDAMRKRCKEHAKKMMKKVKNKKTTDPSNFRKRNSSHEKNHCNR